MKDAPTAFLRAGMPSAPRPMMNTLPAAPSAAAIASSDSGGLSMRVSRSASDLACHSASASASCGDSTRCPRGPPSSVLDPPRAKSSPTENFRSG